MFMKRLLLPILWAFRQRVLARWPGMGHSRHPAVRWLRRLWRLLTKPRVAAPSRVLRGPKVSLPMSAQTPAPLPALNWAQKTELQRLAPATARLRERLMGPGGRS